MTPSPLLRPLPAPPMTFTAPARRARRVPRPSPWQALRVALEADDAAGAEAALGRLDAVGLRALYRRASAAAASAATATDAACFWRLGVRALRRLRPDWRRWLVGRCGGELPMLLDLALSGPLEDFELRWRELERGAHDPTAVALGHAARVYTLHDDAADGLATMATLRERVAALRDAATLRARADGRLDLGARLPHLPALEG